MQLLETIEIRGSHPGRIELSQGDLTDLSSRERADLLLVSAFPDDYEPTPGSLIGALHRKGLSVKKLARHKDIDLRTTYSCWLSRKLKRPMPGLAYRRIFCFEPRERGRPPEVVGDIFRALTPILAVRPKIRSLVMPIVAAGDRGYGIREMLEPLLEAAINWLEIGLPLERLTIVAHQDAHAEEARQVFRARKAEYEMPSTAPAPAGFDYDVFISYAHANTAEREALEAALQAARPGIRVFVDRHEIEIGVSWQLKIFESLERSRKVVALLSPEYLASKACKEEFGIAWIRGNRIGKDLLFPLYVHTAGLPAYMAYWNYLDCRDGDQSRLAEASQRLLEALDREGPAQKADVV